MAGDYLPSASLPHVCLESRTMNRHGESMWNRGRRLTLCAVAFFSAALAWASVGGSISGVIKDPSGRVVPGAQVTVRQVSTGLAYKTLSNDKGYYTFPVLPVGQYELDVQAPGFSGYLRKNVTLDTNAAITLDISLEVGSI